MDTAQPPAAILLSSEEALVDAVLDVAALAGVSVSVARSPDLMETGVRAPLLLVGSDAGERAVVPGGRQRTVVVSLGDDADAPPEEALRTARAWQADHVVGLPAGRGWLVGVLAAAGSGGSEEGAVLAVVPGQGGAGASVLSAALGLAAAARGLRCLLIDADPAAGGTDLLVDAEARPGARWREVASLASHLRPGDLASILPRSRGLAVLSHEPAPTPRPAAPDEEAVLACARADFDVVVVDCPGADSYPAWVARADAAVLVTRAEVRASAAAAGPAAWLRDSEVPRELVVRTHGRIGLRPRDVAAVLGVPLTAQLRTERRIADAVENGELWRNIRTGSMAAVVDALWDRAPLRAAVAA